MAAAVVLVLAVACGDDPPAATPTPSPSYAPGGAPAYDGGGILGPAGDARDTVDQLDEMQRERERRTGG